MLVSRLKDLTGVAAVFALLVGGGALAYATWSRPLLIADAALAANNADGALAAYLARKSGSAGCRSRKYPASRLRARCL